MWIGYPGDIREVPNPKRGLQKTTISNIAEQVALSGALRTSTRRNTPRRWSASFDWLTEAHADWLQDLARRTYGPGPFVVIDASTRNYLAPQQSIGRGRPSLFSATEGSVFATDDGAVQWTRTTNGSLRWVHPIWTRWPIIPALDVSFGHNSAGLPAGLEFFDATGLSLATATDPSGTVTATPPAGARWVQPYLTATGAGDLLAPTACLKYGQPVTAGWPRGEHVAAMSISGHAELIENLPHRSVSLELVEF